MRPEHFQRASVTVLVPRGYEGFWAIIRKLHAAQGEFTIPDIDGESNVDPGSIRKYVRSLVAAGFLEIPRTYQTRGKTCGIYRLVKDQASAPRVRTNGSAVPPSAQQRMWTAVRVLKTFGISDVKFAATIEGAAVSHDTAKRFVSRLGSAGYLNVVRPSRGGRPATWRLKPGMDTGPKPPQQLQLRTDVLFDPNLGRTVGAEPVAREIAQ